MTYATDKITFDKTVTCNNLKSQQEEGVIKELRIFKDGKMLNTLGKENVHILNVFSETKCKIPKRKSFVHRESTFHYLIVKSSINPKDVVLARCIRHYGAQNE